MTDRYDLSDQAGRQFDPGSGDKTLKGRQSTANPTDAPKAMNIQDTRRNQ